MTKHNRERSRDYGRENRAPMQQQGRNRDYSFDFGRNSNDAMRQREFDPEEGPQGYNEGDDNGRRMQTSYYGRDYQQGRDRGDYEGTDMENQAAWNRASRHESYGQSNYGRTNYEGGRGMQSRGNDRGYSQQGGNMDRGGMDRGQDRYMRDYPRQGMESQQTWDRAGNYGTDGSAGMQGSHAGRGPKNYKRRDDRIEEDINEQLTQHHMIDATEIEVAVKDGEVTLRGTVENRDTKRMAEDIAESVSGVKDVHNTIKVQRSQERHDNKKDKGDKEKAA